MKIPFFKEVRIGAYLLKQKLLGRKRYPLVLMLEPLFRCNLACAGCGKIDYPGRRSSTSGSSVAECAGGGRRVRRAGGGSIRGRRTVDCISDMAADRGRHRGAPEEIRVAVHECAAAGEEARPVRAVFALSAWLGAPGRATQGARTTRSVCQEGAYDRGVERRSRRRRRAASSLQRESPPCSTAMSSRGAWPRTSSIMTDGAGRRWRHGVARLRLRARARPGALPQPPTRPRSCSAGILEPRARQAPEPVAQPVRLVPGFPRRQPVLPLHAVGQCRPATVFGWRAVPAICSAKATRRRSGN